MSMITLTSTNSPRPCYNSQRYDSNYFIHGIRLIIYQISQFIGKIVHFLWVPSHCGIIDNETMDHAERNGFNSEHSATMKILHNNN